MDEMLTINEVATQLRVTPQTVRNWISRGELPKVHAGRGVRVQRRDLEAFLGHRAATGADAAPADDTAREEFAHALASVVAVAATESSPNLIAALRALARASDALASSLEPPHPRRN